MREILQTLFLVTGAVMWVVIAGLAGVCLLALVIDYGWRSLRWLFGLPRGSGIWLGPVKRPARATTPQEPRFPSWVDSDAAKATESAPLAQHPAWAAGEAPQQLPTTKEAQ